MTQPAKRQNHGIYVNRGVSFTPETWQQLQDVAYARHISRNRLITEILQVWLAENWVPTDIIAAVLPYATNKTGEITLLVAAPEETTTA